MNHYEANGIAALLPGIAHVLEFVEGELDRMLQLVGPGSGDSPISHKHYTDNQEQQDAQPPRTKQSLGGQRAWQNMTPKQKRARIAAMHRGRQLRQRVTQGKE